MSGTEGSTPGAAARRLAAELVVRVGEDGAYANLVVPAALERSSLSVADRGLVTDLTYGTVRMRRAVDWLLAPHVRRAPTPLVAALLAVGVYQLRWTDTPPYAAVSATVAASPGRQRGFVNAVLRRVAADERPWPDEPTRLSYPDWIVTRLETDLGPGAAHEALARMNEAPGVSRRADGYVQDPASRWVAEAVDARPGQLILDACAAPGGKATALAGTGATVVAADRNPGRLGLVAANAARIDPPGPVVLLAADAALPPLAGPRFDRVLVDAPCSGLGVLRRRPDARWRIKPDDVERLAALQRRILDAIVPLVAPGGLLVYSVCTLTAEETLGVDGHLARAHPELEALDPPAAPWRPRGRGAQLLPQDADSDGMFLLRLRVPTSVPAHG